MGLRPYENEDHMKHKRTILLCILGAGLAMTVNAQSPAVINDSNTPLHLMQPQYENPYGIPQKSDVEAVIGRICNYLDAEMPHAIDSDGRAKKGSFRLTSYEAGVLYSAMLNARINGISSEHVGAMTSFATERLDFLSEQSAKMASKFKKDPDYDSQLRLMVRPRVLDDGGAMCAAFCKLSCLAGKDTPQKQYAQTIERYMHMVLNDVYRMKVGSDSIFARNRPHHNTVWLDDMFMGVPALAWYSAYLQKNGDSSLSSHIMNLAISQVRLFKELMWVPEKKLFRHGWVESMSPHASYHWGRANGWAILTLCEVIDAINAIDDNGKNGQQASSFASYKAELLLLLREHIEGLCALQDKTGFWHQLLDRPDTYFETSCTAIYTYCISHAVCEGWVNAETYGAQAFLAWNALQTKVNEQGQVEGTCVGTGMGFDPAFYAYRPTHKMAMHGYGPTIWAATEILRMLSLTHPKMNDSAVHFYPTPQNTDKPIFEENAAEKEILW